MKQLDGLELLLVEDDPNDAQYLQRLLVESGTANERLIDVETVHRAQRLELAFELLEDDPDVVLLDLMLPDSEGLETVEAVVEYAPHVPVVVITGRRDSDLGPAAIREGAQDYLSKGRITDEVLHRTLRYAIDRHDSQHEVVELNHRLSVLNRIVRQDIRNDMNMVVGQGTELRERVGEETETVDSLLDAAHHAIELTDRVSELITVLSTDHELDLEPLAIDEVIDEQAARIESTHDVSLTIDRGEMERDQLTVLATPSIGSAFEEILSNAVRHNDSETPQVTITFETTGETVSVVVADNGIGISDVQKDILNDPRARYHERSQIGTGLYLALTIVEQVGGIIEFADNHPEGTVVTTELELVTPAEQS